MAKDTPKQTLPPVAMVLAWVLPGAGHWYIGRPARAIILFLTIHLLFWSGIALGGVLTVDPQEQKWWFRAQALTGVSWMYSWQRQAREYSGIARDAAEGLEPLPDRERPEAFAARAQQEQAERGLALGLPTSDVAYIFTGVAGMLNLLCIFDALILSLMGRYGEPAAKRAVRAELAEVRA